MKIFQSERPVSRAQRAKNETYTFLSMNRFWPEKRLDIIIEAASILKQKGYHFHVQLAGSVMPHIPESRIYYEVLQRMTEVCYTHIKLYEYYFQLIFQL